LTIVCLKSSLTPLLTPLVTVLCLKNTQAILLTA
jgi:hypothetical protein